MSPAIPVQLKDILTLAAMASKTCEYHVHFTQSLHEAGEHIVAEQISGMLHNTIMTLGKLDKQAPGMMPVPHTGETWAEIADSLAAGEKEIRSVDHGSDGE